MDSLDAGSANHVIQNFPMPCRCIMRVSIASTVTFRLHVMPNDSCRILFRSKNEVHACHRHDWITTKELSGGVHVDRGNHQLSAAVSVIIVVK
jgi:hypothetical protein